MRRSEEQFNSPEQVGEYLDQALAIMAERGLATNDHPALLVKVVELVAGKQVFFEQPQQLSPAEAFRLGLAKH